MAENFTPIQLQTFINDTSAVNAVNNNFAVIANLLNDVLSRSGVTPNQMNSTLDMNSNQIINLPFPTTLNSPARLADVTNAQNISIVTATTGTSGHVVPFLDGTNSWSAPQALNLSSGTGYGFLVQQTSSGNIGTPTLVLNGWTINDTVNNGTSGSFVDGVGITHTYGGSTTQGGRQSLSVFAQLNSPTNVGNTNRTYVAISGTVNANSGDGGSGTGSGNSLGLFTGGQFTVEAAASATNIFVATAANFNSGCLSGSSMYAKSLIQLAGAPSDAVAGSGINTMAWFFNQGSAVKWSQAILMDNGGGLGSFPVASTGTLIKSTAGSVAVGIDFTGMTFSGNSIQTPGFAVTQFGAITSGGAGVGNGTIQLFGNSSGNATIIASSTAALVTVSQAMQVGTIGTVPGVLTLAGATSGGAQISSSATGSTLVMGAGNASIDTSGNYNSNGNIKSSNTTALPTGGNSSVNMLMSTASVGVYAGTGNPTVSAAKGSIYLENGTGQLWLNTSGSTTWTQITVP